MDVNNAIPNPIRSAAIARGDHVVLVDDTGTWTAQTLLDQVLARAGQLVDEGIEPGHTVALTGPYNKEWVRDLHAIGWIGAAVAPLEPGLPSEASSRRISALKPEVILESGQPLSTTTTRVEERFWPQNEVRLFATTSGTTGEPEIVSLTTGQLLLSAFGSATRLGLDPSDRWLACLPLHHIAGLSILYRSAFYGTTCVLHPSFDAKRVAACLDEGSISVISLVPTMLEAILERRGNTPFPDALRAILLGGAPASEGLLLRAQELKLPLATTWGMTEAASQVATAFPGKLPEDGAVGPPLPFARVEEESGTLHIRGPIVDGTLSTADRGSINERGEILVKGRKDDLIISGGENIDPREVEEALLSHPSIAEAGVIGIPDEKWGERMMAVLVAPPTQNRPPAEEILSWCKERLGAHRTPREIRWQTALPRNAMGKLSRGRLRKDMCP